MIKHISIHWVDEPGRTLGTVTAVMQADPLSRVYAEEHSGHLPCPFLGTQDYLFRPVCPLTYHLQKGRDIWYKTRQITTLAKVVIIHDHTLQPHDV